MAEHQLLYQRAVYYDIIFNRDVSREVDFISAVFQRETGRQLNSVLEIACGPGYHARGFARRGVLAAGLDLRPEMIDFARSKDALEGMQLEWLVADMRDFQLDHPVDLVFNIFDGLDALLTNKDLVKHFQAVAGNLAPDGIYVVDLTHPRDCNYERYGSYSYRGELNGTSVEIVWATNEPKFDRITGVAKVDVEMRVKHVGGEEIVIADTATERMLMPQEITLLAELSGDLEVVDWYGDFDLEVPFDAPAARRMICILKKVG